MGPRKPNAKAVAAKERQAAQQASKDAEAARQREKQEEAEWKKGSNVRGQSRAESEAQKADEAARKKREKAELLAAEEEAAAASGGVKKAPGSGMSAKKNKSKKKKKDEFSLLEEALVGDAEKKSKAAKRAERLRKEREERQAADAAAKRAQAAGDAKADPLLANTDAMIGAAAEYNEGGGTDMLIGRSANVAMSADGGSGLDSALGALSMGGSPRDDAHPEKRAKALHLAFEEKMMPQMKEDYPGLRMTQYKEKIFALWKKSPENPHNWPKPQQSSSSPRKGK